MQSRSTSLNRELYIIIVGQALGLPSSCHNLIGVARP